MPVITEVPALVVGAGPIGLACAVSAVRREIEHLVIDAGAITESIVRYPIGMTFFTTPERLEIGGHPLVCSGAKATREEALKYYRGVVRSEELTVRTYARLADVERDGDALWCRITTRLGDERVRCERLVLATGYFDHPNLLGVPGEDLPHVSHWFDEAHRSAGLDVVVVGGKNSAVETALQCYRAGAQVTLVHRRAAFGPGVKYWLRPDFDNRVAHGEIAARFGATVREITERSVAIVAADGAVEHLRADRVFVLTGYHPDFALLERIGVALAPDTGRAILDPLTLESSVPGLFLAGSVAAGRQTSEVFIENGRFDGEKIFGDAPSRRTAQALYAATVRPVGE